MQNQDHGCRIFFFHVFLIADMHPQFCRNFATCSIMLSHISIFEAAIPRVIPTFRSPMRRALRRVRYNPHTDAIVRRAISMATSDSPSAVPRLLRHHHHANPWLSPSLHHAHHTSRSFGWNGRHLPSDACDHSINLHFQRTVGSLVVQTAQYFGF